MRIGDSFNLSMTITLDSLCSPNSCESEFEKRRIRIITRFKSQCGQNLSDYSYAPDQLYEIKYSGGDQLTFDPQSDELNLKIQLINQLLPFSINCPNPEMVMYLTVPICSKYS